MYLFFPKYSPPQNSHALIRSKSVVFFDFQQKSLEGTGKKLYWKPNKECLLFLFFNQVCISTQFKNIAKKNDFFIKIIIFIQNSCFKREKNREIFEKSINCD